MRIPSNRVRDIVRYMHAELDGLYGEGEVKVFAEELFNAFLQWDRTHLLLHRDETINQSDLLRFHWAIEDLKKYRPIQHIIGYTNFCGCRICVSPDVLIPRPETEEMVEWIAGHAPLPYRSIEEKPQRGTNVFDICTGSGCIAIALKKAFPEAEVTAMDISPKALALANRNASDNNVEIRFVQDDILNIASQPTEDAQRGKELCSSFDLIVSNPPYVRDSERASMSPNVLDYEPELALFVPDDDPLRFYHAIGDYASRHLAPQGLLVLEINEALANETCSLLKTQGFATEVHTDFRDKPRWISARINLEKV